MRATRHTHIHLLVGLVTVIMMNMKIDNFILFFKYNLGHKVITYLTLLELTELST